MKAATCRRPPNSISMVSSARKGISAVKISCGSFLPGFYSSADLIDI